MIKKPVYLITLAVIVALSFSSILAKSDPTATLYPTKGSIYTDIYLQVRGFGGTLYLFWDDKLIGTYTEYKDPRGQDYQAFTGFDIHFKAPNEYNYSNTGVHRVSMQINWKYWDGQFYVKDTSFNLPFEIVEYYPPPSMFSTWLNSLSADARAQLVGKQGPTGPQGATGSTGTQGPIGPKGEKGVSYPLEMVYLNVGISALAMIVSVIAFLNVRKHK